MSPYQRGLLWHPIEESASCPISLNLLYQVLCFLLHALTPSDSLSLYYNWEKNKEQLCLPHRYYCGSVCGGKTKIPFAGIYVGFYTYVYWDRPWQLLESRARQSPQKETVFSDGLFLRERFGHMYVLAYVTEWGTVCLILTYYMYSMYYSSF